MLSMRERDPLTKLESRLSLAAQLGGCLSSAIGYFGLWPLVIGLGVAVFAALHRVLGWVDQYGWAGWFLLALASIAIVGWSLGIVFVALSRYAAFKQSREAVPSVIPSGGELAALVERATSVGRLEEQQSAFEAETRSALNKLQFTLSDYRSTIGKVNDAFAGLRLLRLGDRANRELDTAREFMSKVERGEWTDWENWGRARASRTTYRELHEHDAPLHGALRRYIPRSYQQAFASSGGGVSGSVP